MKLWGDEGEAIVKTVELPELPELPDSWSSEHVWDRASVSSAVTPVTTLVTLADDVPTESSHMPATATSTAATAAATDHQHHQHSQRHDAHPRIYLSPRVAGDHTAASGIPPAPTATANMDVLRQTYRAATSKTAQRTLLNTVLLTFASTFLYALAAAAYIIFYNAYLPDQVTTLPIHLQYGYGPNPYGVSSLPNMKDYQAYDISVSLTLPRSPTNVDRGNFMIALYLLDRPGTATSTSTSPPDSDHQPLATTPASLLPTPDPRSYLSTRRVLHTSHRPALIPYTDPIVSLASRLLFLPGHLLFPSSSRASTASLTIPLAEKLSFPSPQQQRQQQQKASSASAVPTFLFLELQSGQDLRVAAATVTVTAQLSGVRWLMHSYRLSAFLAGTAAFWACEVVFMAAAWVILSALLTSATGDQKPPKLDTLGGGKPDSGRRKIDEGDMSDTERTFPTTSRAPPLKYESVKEEGVEVDVDMAELPVAPEAEADDEDDEEEGDEGEGGVWRDSGIGTSYSDAGAGIGRVRRRASGKGR